MTTQEKLIKILSRGCEIKIYPRGYPPDEGIQGFLPARLSYTSEEEGRVTIQPPFCIGYVAKWENKEFFEHFFEFPIFIDHLYESVFKKEEVPVEVLG